MSLEACEKLLARVEGERDQLQRRVAELEAQLARVREVVAPSWELGCPCCEVDA